MPADRVRQFRDRQTNKPVCAKSTLRSGEVGRSVERSIEKLPRLAQLNPDAALLIERSIDDWMVPSSPPEDGDRQSRLQQTLTFRRQARAPLLKIDARAVI